MFLKELREISLSRNCPYFKETESLYFHHKRHSLVPITNHKNSNYVGFQFLSRNITIPCSFQSPSNEPDGHRSHSSILVLPYRRIFVLGSSLFWGRLSLEKGYLRLIPFNRECPPLKNDVNVG